MTRFIRLIGCTLGLLFGAAAFAGETSSESFIDTLSPADADPPQVLMRSEGQAEWRAAQAGLELLPGDSVKTESGGTCTVHVGGKAVIDLEPNSMLTVPASSTDGAPVTKVSVDAGSAWSTVRQLDTGEAFSVETQHSVGGVKGTQFLTTVTPNGGDAEWSLVDGSLQMTPRGGTGSAFSLQQGQTTTFGRGGVLRVRPRAIRNMSGLRNRFQQRFRRGLRSPRLVGFDLRRKARLHRPRGRGPFGPGQRRRGPGLQRPGPQGLNNRRFDNPRQPRMNRWQNRRTGPFRR